MSEADKSRLAALTARLAGPSAPQGPLGRLVARGTPEVLLSALLRELDETVLARRLAFSTDTGKHLRCDAYGRRLLAVDPGKVAPPLGDLDEDGRNGLRKDIETPLAGASELYVNATPLNDDRDPTDFGIPTESLIEGWALAPPPPPPSPIEALTSVSDAALAWLRLDGTEETGRGGIADQTNFHAFEGLRFYQCPEIEVRGLENGSRVHGIGEPPVPPAAPALAGAIFAATGKRLREMPFNKFVDFA